MKMLTQNEISNLKRIYPVGSIVELIHMNDAQAPPAHTKGEILFIDDIGKIHIRWENGSSLGLIYGVDKFKLIKKGKTGE